MTAPPVSADSLGYDYAEPVSVNISELPNDCLLQLLYLELLLSVQLSTMFSLNIVIVLCCLANAFSFIAPQKSRVDRIHRSGVSSLQVRMQFPKPMDHQIVLNLNFIHFLNRLTILGMVFLGRSRMLPSH